MLRSNEGAVLDRVATGVFDNPVDARWAAEFFADPRHHLAVAIQNGEVIGMASAVHYVHPDKPPELWVNEVGVAPVYQNQGIGRRLMQALFERGRELDCTEAWLGTERTNASARRMYSAAGGVESDEFVIVTFNLADE
ncbi:MAG: GNAT family N-acetyltransferase [Gemmatimonadota bacterium]